MVCALLVILAGSYRVDRLAIETNDTVVRAVPEPQAIIIIIILYFLSIKK